MINNFDNLEDNNFHSSTEEIVLSEDDILSVEKNKREKDKAIKSAKRALESLKELLQWPVKPDSWIDPKEYILPNITDNKEIEVKKENKLRVNYFHRVVGHLFLLLNIMPLEISKPLNEKIENFIISFKQKREENEIISTEVVREMDNLAEEIIKKAETYLK